MSIRINLDEEMAKQKKDLPNLPEKWISLLPSSLF